MRQYEIIITPASENDLKQIFDVSQKVMKGAFR